jgi:diguanylate cyclase (GGDEF)-like protein
MHRAFYDSLTGLPNRMLFMERLAGAAARLRRSDAPSIAVLFIDLDRFKVINDTFGHRAGDALLIEVGRRIESCLRPGDTVARMSQNTVARLAGDEFTVLIENVRDMADALRIAGRVADFIANPYVIEGRQMEVTASIGVAVSAPGFDAAEDLLRGADAAMYRAKSLGKARYEVCDRNVHEQALERLRMEHDLHGVADRGELRVVYQPIVSVKSGELAGFEALLRWQHPTRGLLMPDQFIGIAEEANLIHPISLWVLSRACAQLREWRDGRNLRMAVNISGKDLAYAEFPAALDAILEECGADASLLKLEITETAVVRHTEAAVRMMEALRRRNVRVSIDDFGTGYSSFAYLRQFPIDTLKIDRSFMRGMTADNENGHLVRAMIGLASILGMSAVAEGVETAEQLDVLRRFGCGYAQGFLFSPPLTAAEAEKLLARA